MLIAIVITAALLTGADYFASQVHWVGWFAYVLLLLALVIECSIFGGGMMLAMILWIIRLSHWGYARFRTLFERTSPPSGLPAYRSRRRLPARRPIKNLLPPVPSTGEKAKAKADAKQKAKAKAGEETEAYYRSEFQRLLGETKAKRVKMEAKKAEAQAEQKAKAKTKAEEEIEAYYESEYQRFLAEAEAKIRAQPEQIAEARAQPEQIAEARAQAEQKAEAEAKARPRLRRRRRLKQGK
ncbi:hypothetical protein ES703_113875 [subsurface metagenome]